MVLVRLHQELASFSKDYPVGLAIRKAKKLALGMELSQYEAKKLEED